MIAIWEIHLTHFMHYRHFSQPKELSQRIPFQLREAIKDPAAAYITQQLGALPIRHRVRKDRQNVITILRMQFQPIALLITTDLKGNVG